MLLSLGFMGLSIAFVAFGVTCFFVENKLVFNSRESQEMGKEGYSQRWVSVVTRAGSHLGHRMVGRCLHELG